jgi:hypothetical protein
MLLRDDEQRAIRRIDRHHRKLNVLYAEYPQFKVPTDSVSGEVVINNPILKRDTIIRYRDTVRIKTIQKLIYERCKDSSLASKVGIELAKYKCIEDTISITDTLFKVLIFQDLDNGGVGVSIIPDTVKLKSKYKKACPPVYVKQVKYYQHKEFWFATIFLLVLHIITALVAIRK